MTQRNGGWTPICEGALLGGLLEDPTQWPAAEQVSPNDFVLADNQKIFRAMQTIRKRGDPPDIVMVMAEVGESVRPDYVASLLDGAVPENCSSYVRHIRESKRDRQFQQLLELLEKASTVEDRLALLELMSKSLQPEGDTQNWRAIFHSIQEFEDAPPLRFAIDGFLQEAGVTLIGGLAGHGKTLLMLAMAKALLDESPLFGYKSFSVPRPAARILYLVPESSIGPFWSRIKLFRLEGHIRSDRLLVRTLSSREQVPLNDPRMLNAAEGADVFLDTAIRFMVGEENSAAEQKLFAETLFNLQRAGARTITGAHHSPKSFGKDTFMTLENVLRGSGDIGAMAATCWGLVQIDGAKNRIFVQNVKPRDFRPCSPFIIQGRPSIDETGYFELTEPPDFAGSLADHKSDKNPGRPPVQHKNEKFAEAARLKQQGMTLRDIAEKVGVSKSTLSNWFSDEVEIQ